MCNSSIITDIFEFSRKLSTISPLSFEDCENIGGEIVMNGGSLKKTIDIYNLEGIRGIDTYLIQLKMNLI